jgi:hypothetical protein
MAAQNITDLATDIAKYVTAMGDKGQCAAKTSRMHAGGLDLIEAIVDFMVVWSWRDW